MERTAVWVGPLFFFLCAHSGDPPPCPRDHRPFKFLPAPGCLVSQGQGAWQRMMTCIRNSSNQCLLFFPHPSLKSNCRGNEYLYRIECSRPRAGMSQQPVPLSPLVGLAPAWHEGTLEQKAVRWKGTRFQPLVPGTVFTRASHLSPRFLFTGKVKM